MTRTPVASRSIRSIGHEGSTLEVEFSSGAVYRYDGVTAAHVEDLLKAPSLGKHFATHIKGGGFAFTKVARDPHE
jgi:hypothetical protein